MGSVRTTMCGSERATTSAGLDERLLALDEKLRELHEPADGHEPRVGEEAHERGRENLSKDVTVQQRAARSRW